MCRASYYALALLLSSISLPTILQRQSLAQVEGKESQELPTRIPESVDERAAFTILVCDRDGDGKIARSEAPGPVYLDNFDRFDLNRDGILVLAEIKAASRQLRMSPGAAASYRKYLERFDEDKDGRISKTEAETDTELATEFANSDLDHDGSLSEYEVAAMVRTRQVIEFQKKYKPSDQTADAEPKHKNASELKTAPSPRRLPPMTAEAAKQFLSRFDTDRDGVISAEEGNRGPFVRNFKRWDTDSSGTIDVDELLKSGLRVSVGGPQDFLKTILDRSDKDGDGQLSADELPPIFQRFMDKLDKDEDGTLSAKELEELSDVIRTGGGRSSGGQRADPNFKPTVSKATYSDTDAPTIAIDAGHRNFHTKEGRYQACAKVLEADGAKVIEHSERFSVNSLSSIDVLVIANALPEGRLSRGAPVPSAFSDDEIGVLVRWIESGGSLLLLADHVPYGEAAKKLGTALGVDMQGGFVLGPDKTNAGRITFARADESLLPHAVTNGSGKETKIASVVTFTGQALKGDDKYAPILALPEGVSYRANRGPASNSEALPDLRGWHQGIVGQLGEGRVAVFGEAGMFSAQLSGSDRKMGMNAEGAEQNQQLLLNLVHWLNGDL